MSSALPTDEDMKIRLDRACNRHPHSWIATLRADERDAEIMRRLGRTRRNNKRARAFPEETQVST